MRRLNGKQRYAHAHAEHEWRALRNDVYEYSRALVEHGRKNIGVVYVNGESQVHIRIDESDPVLAEMRQAMIERAERLKAFEAKRRRKW